MLSPELETDMNRQIAAELSSSHRYLAVSAYFEAESLPGFAHWFRVQAEEERDHAMRFFAQVVDRGGRVRIEALEAPPDDFGSPLGALEGTLEHERTVTGMIDALFGEAVRQGDYASQVFLQWFVQEQVEEEKQAADLVRMLSTVGSDPVSLLMLDRELGARSPRAEGAASGG
ncbi:MAG: ferritin [Actinomycetota bacterium]